MTYMGPQFTPEKALEILKQGNERRIAQLKKKVENTISGKQFHERRNEPTEEQRPLAVLVSCSDLRFPPEMVFHNREGDFFVVRTAGHVVDNDASWSIEYAVKCLKAPLIVVMGHDKCGTVTEAVNRLEGAGHIYNIVERIYPAVEKVRNTSEDLVSAAIDQHVRDTVVYLKNLEPICKEFVESGKLMIIGARCNIETYRVEWY